MTTIANDKGQYARGLLRRCQHEDAAAVPRVSCVAVVTCNRPAGLHRALGSAMTAARAQGRVFEYLVVDDSTDARTGGHNRAIAAALGAEHGFAVRYGGRVERARFAAALAADGALPEELVRFALLGAPGFAGTCGANRNALLLDTAGVMVLSADDDTAWRVPRGPAPSGLALGLGRDVGAVETFDDLDHAWRSVAWHDQVDLAALHEQLLGRTVADCIRGLARPAAALDCDPLPPPLEERIATGRCRIPVTQMGFIGDPGTASPFPLLSLEGASRDRLVSCPARYRRARTARAAMRRVPRATASASCYCMSYVLGLDNRQGLPPFFPVLRNSDAIFGLSLRMSDPDAWIGQIPHAVQHAPAEPRCWGDEDIWRGGTRWRMGDLMPAALAAAARRERVVGRGWAALGAALVALADEPLADFEAAVDAERRSRQESCAAQLERLLDRHGRQPSFWAADVQRALAALAEERRDPRPKVPEDLPGPAPELERRRLAQGLVRAFGQLLGAWQVILAAASRRRQDHLRLTQPA